MARIEIEIENYLDEVGTRILLHELTQRKIGASPSDGIKIAQELRDAYYRRDASRFEAILTAHLDPIEIKQSETQYIDKR